MNEVVPLIYTKNGNVPERDLSYQKEWKISDEYIVFCEAWFDSEGDLVKNNVHMYSLKGGPAIGGQQAVMQ